MDANTIFELPGFKKDFYETFGEFEFTKGKFLKDIMKLHLMKIDEKDRVLIEVFLNPADDNFFNGDLGKYLSKMVVLPYNCLVFTGDCSVAIFFRAENILVIYYQGEALIIKMPLNDFNIEYANFWENVLLNYQSKSIGF